MSLCVISCTLICYLVCGLCCIVFPFLYSPLHHFSPPIFSFLVFARPSSVLPHNSLLCRCTPCCVMDVLISFSEVKPTDPPISGTLLLLHCILLSSYNQTTEMFIFSCASWKLLIQGHKVYSAYKRHTGIAYLFSVYMNFWNCDVI